MSDLLVLMLGGALIVGVEILVLGLLTWGWNRDLRIQGLQLMEAWRQTRIDWERAHQENMQLNRDHSVALRAVLERVERQK